MNNWLEIIQQSIFPPTCLFCDSSGFDKLDICKPCLDALPKDSFVCQRCGVSMVAIDSPPSVCGKCLSKPPAFAKSLSLFRYQGPIRLLIHQLKFQNKLVNARLMGELMARFANTVVEDRPQMLVPIPLHPRRFRQRGFNQASEIAKPISRRLAIPLNTRCCRRILDTAPQFELPAKARLKNIRNAFVVKNLPLVDHIAIIDDVVTTATTVNALAMELRKSGVKKIEVWSFARASLD